MFPGGVIHNSRFGKMTAHAVRSLLQHRLRAALSILGVICGVTVVMALLLIGEGAKREALEQIEQLGIKNIYVRSVPLTKTQESSAASYRSLGLGRYDVARILAGGQLFAQIASVKEVNADIVSLSSDAAPQVLECSANLGTVLNLFLAQGRFLSAQDVLESSQVCVLGETVANRLGAQGVLGNYLRINSSLYRIVGILREVRWKEARSSTVATRNYNAVVFIPLRAEGHLTAGTADKNPSMPELTEIIVQVRSRELVATAVELVKRIMAISHGEARGYQIVSPQELLWQVKKTQRTFNLLLGFIAAITLFVGGIGIMNIMLATVTERTREIGIRRALGASRDDIMIQFLTEAVILTGSGGIIGVVTGLLVAGVAAQLTDWQIQVTFPAIFVPLAMSLIVGIAFGMYPAKQAAGMDPVEALRHE